MDALKLSIKPFTVLSNPRRAVLYASYPVFAAILSPIALIKSPCLIESIKFLRSTSGTASLGVQPEPRRSCSEHPPPASAPDNVATPLSLSELPLYVTSLALKRVKSAFSSVSDCFSAAIVVKGGRGEAVPAPFAFSYVVMSC